MPRLTDTALRLGLGWLWEQLVIDDAERPVDEPAGVGRSAVGESGL
jgi:hypothetical protein